jgi:hypothetical protein
MSDTTFNPARRTLLKGIAIVPAALALGAVSTVSAEMVGLSDPMAIALQYTETSTNPEQNCANCVLYTADGDDKGACSLFPGKQVAAAGWCISWALKS